MFQSLFLMTIGSLIGVAEPQRVMPYLGPETIMPLASILAAIAGFFLIFWRYIARIAKTIYRKIRGLPREIPPEMDDDKTDSNND